MLKCNTLIINGNNDTNGLSIGESELIIENDGIKLKDNNGQVKKLNSNINSISITVNNIIQSISNNNISDIY